MRYSTLALAAFTLISGSVAARGHQQHRRHAHPAALAPRGECEVAPPTCVTYTSSILVPVGTVSSSYSSPPTTVKQTLTVVPVVEPTTTIRSTTTSTSYSTAVVTVTRSSSSSPKPSAAVPTPVVTVCPTPGVYTFPAKTIILTSTEYACVPTTTSLPPGPNVYGGVTTVVVTATTVVCPYATVEADSGVTTSKVIMTTYVCPSAGTYTIGPTTTTVTGTVTVPCEYPVPTAYGPGTYVQPELITTVTVTSQVVTCPYTNGIPEPTSAPTSTPAPPPPDAPAPPAVPSAAPSVPSYIPDPPASTTQPANVPSPTSTSKAPIGGGPWALTYSPYTAEGGCKTSDQVHSDIASIASKGFKNVRVYSTDCSGLENIGAACEKNGLGIILGVFIKAGGISTAEDQLQAILKWNKLSLVIMFVVGNESVFNGFCTAEELAIFIKRAKTALQGVGYNGPVTTTETLNILQAHGDVLCPVMDVVGCNVHPFFNPQVTADQAGTFLASQLQIARDVCGGKEGYVFEAGWPSAGNPNGAAVPGTSEQRTAITAILKEAPGQVVFFTYENDLWKAGGAFDVEKNFGCADLF